MADQAKQASVSDQIRWEVAWRAQKGAIIYPLVAITTVSLTAIGKDHPLESTGYVLALLTMSVVRHRVGGRACKEPSERTFLALVASVASQAAIWGSFTAATFLWYGLHTLTWLELMFTAGFASAGTSALGLDRKMTRAFLLGLILPVALASLITDPSIGLVIAVVSAIFSGYLLHDAKQKAESFEALLRTQDELRAARDNALSADRMKGAFLATMSHEMRTPLHATIGSASLLLETGLDERQKRYANTVVQAADSLLGLINDVLDFSRIEAQGIEFVCDDFVLGDALDNVLAMFEPLAKRSGIELRASFDRSTERVVTGDARRIQQIFVNLLGNAVKFTERGHVELSAELRPVASGFVLDARVTDTGIGISAEEQARIFQPFVQADTGAARKYAGSGLGLAISKRLAEAMGGSIEVQSAPGKGSSFRVTVQLGESRASAVPSIEPSYLPARSVPPRYAAFTGRVLLVDDNALNRVVGSEMLRQLGCEVKEAPGGREAIALLSTEDFELVLMDCQMAGMDGYETTRRLREDANTRSLPIIAVTANALEEDRRRALDAGMNDVMPKPFGLGELATLLAQWLRPLIDNSGPVAIEQRVRSESLYPAAKEHLQVLLGPAGDADRIDHIVALFLRQWPLHHENLLRAHADNDGQLARETLHALVGTGSFLGVRRLNDVLSEMQDLARNAELERVLACLPRLTQSVEGLEQSRARHHRVKAAQG